MVEFVIVLPILAVLLFGITQFGLAFHNYLSITDAARAGARAAVVEKATACTEAKAAINRTVSTTQWGVIETRITCSSPTGTSGTPWTVSITYPYKISLLGISLISANLTASATERVE
jgi:Flp pilus assembly protein TadG